jgi:hypothetical protein
LLRDWRKDDSCEESYIESLMELDKIEYYCDLFLYGTRTDLEEFKQNEERLVKRIEQRVRDYKRQQLGQATPLIGN